MKIKVICVENSDIFTATAFQDFYSRSYFIEELNTWVDADSAFHPASGEIRRLVIQDKWDKRKNDKSQDKR
jgi:hypothetical protein